MKGAYYNENDPYAAQWLRNLIAAGHIAPGDVDERSIVEVRPGDLRGYAQCHFFAGIGGWSYALRLAGWGDERPVWTGSCPCQPFSAAGKRKAGADERHLWPVWLRLIRECRAPIVFGEQVEAAVGMGWLDRVFADLEAEDYACGAAVLGAHSVGAPHIRQRLYWVADASSARRIGPLGRPEREARDEARMRVPCADGGSGRLADADDARSQGRSPGGNGADERAARAGGVDGGMADAARDGRREERALGDGRDAGDRAQGLPAGLGAGDADRRPHPSHGFWDAPDWLLCRDAKWRPVEPGTFPLVDGAPARVGRLRAYGNAIVPQAAAAFIRAAEQVTQQQRGKP